MLAYIARRLLLGVVLVFSVSVLVFSMMYIMPGDPVDLMIDRKVPKNKREELKIQYGFDRPLYEQYFNWAKKIVLNLDFGIALKSKLPVWGLMKDRIPITLKLTGLTLFFEMLFAVPLGLLCAYKKDTLLERFIVNTSLFATAVPVFWVAVLLILLFGVQLKWLPLSGYKTPQHLILPVAAGVITSVAGTIRMIKMEVLDVYREKYVLTAYAKGLPKSKVIIRHVLRNALIIVSVLVFMSIPWLISGEVIIERIFEIPGMGNLMVKSIIDQDYSVVQGCVLVISVLTVIFNIASDIVICMLDPRIRKSIGGGDN